MDKINRFCTPETRGVSVVDRRPRKCECDWCAGKIGATKHTEPHPFKGTGFTFCCNECVNAMQTFLIREKHDARRSAY